MTAVVIKGNKITSYVTEKTLLIHVLNFCFHFSPVSIDHIQVITIVTVQGRQLQVIVDEEEVKMRFREVH